jgi:hypothetical protein
MDQYAIFGKVFKLRRDQHPFAQILKGNFVCRSTLVWPTDGLFWAGKLIVEP